MQISKKEKIMLAILGIVLVGVAYYQFGYTNLVNLAENKSKEKTEIETKYNKAIDTINNMDSQKSKVKILNAKIVDEAKPLYPTISQEHLILDIDKLIKDSGLEGGMTFEKEEVSSIEYIKKSENDSGLLESSIQGIADKYNYKYGDKEKNNSESKEKTETSDTSKSTSDTDKNSKDNSKEKATDPNTVNQIKVKMDFNGSYESVVKFLKAIGDYDRKIPAYGITMSTKSLSEVKGEVALIIYSVPKIDDDMSKYLIWTLKNNYGKGQPFNINSGVGNGIKSTNELSDFMLSAKSINSELPTVMMGRANDNLRTSYVYADGNNEQQAELILTQDGDKYYYKYKTLTNKMPENYDGVGNQFVPSGENIVINVLSESRVTSNDKSGVKLKVVNNTNKLVKVDVSGEDIKDPRVSIEGDSTNISVNQK